MKSKTKKEHVMSVATTIIIVIGSLGIICYFGSAFLFADVLNGNYSEDTMEKYESEKTRIDYFNKNKNDFETLADIFEKYPEIREIGNEKTICYDNEIIINKDVALCSVKDNIKIEEKDKKAIRDSFNHLDVIIDIMRTGSYDKKEKYYENSITFYMVTSVNDAIFYSYCFEKSTCDLKEENITGGEEKYQKAKIDNNWLTVYDSRKRM